ncbi:hypothetical protein CKO18_07675 [Rhodoferax fermentans]|nr:hypothetical protein [Rhodoferax fermentans]
MNHCLKATGFDLANSGVTAFAGHKATSVKPLCFNGFPFAVLGRVTLVVVFALKRMLLRGLHPHVQREVLKRLPAFANCDPSATVMTVRWIIRVVAALTHQHPGVIERVLFARKTLD